MRRHLNEGWTHGFRRNCILTIGEECNLRQEIKGAILVILSAFIFGLNPLLAKSVYTTGCNPFTLTFLRMIFGTLGMWVIQIVFLRGSLSIRVCDFRKLIICSAGYAITPLLLYSSYNYLDSGVATTLHFIYPVLVFGGCIIFYHEKPEPGKLFCCGLCMVGILCFFSPGGTINIRGIMIALSSGVFFAFYVVYLAKSGLTQLPPFCQGFWLCATSAVIVGIPLFLMGQTSFPGSPDGWLLAILFAFLCSCLATVAFQIGTRFVGPENASLLSTFEPLTSVVIGILYYHETPTLRSFLGIVCILAAVFLLSLQNAKSKAKAVSD